MMVVPESKHKGIIDTYKARVDGIYRKYGIDPKLGINELDDGEKELERLSKSILERANGKEGGDHLNDQFSVVRKQFDTGVAQYIETGDNKNVIESLDKFKKLRDMNGYSGTLFRSDFVNEQADRIMAAPNSAAKLGIIKDLKNMVGPHYTTLDAEMRAQDPGFPQHFDYHAYLMTELQWL